MAGFKDFVLRGNVVDLAVAVVVGGAFGAVVSTLANDVLGSLVAAVVQVPDLTGVGFHLGRTQVVLGTFLAAVVNLVVVSAVLYFGVVVPVNRLLERRRSGEEPEVRATPEDVALLQEIRDLLRQQVAAPGHREP